MDKGKVSHLVNCIVFAMFFFHAAQCILRRTNAFKLKGCFFKRTYVLQKKLHFFFLPQKVYLAIFKHMLHYLHGTCLFQIIYMFPYNSIDFLKVTMHSEENTSLGSFKAFFSNEWWFTVFTWCLPFQRKWASFSKMSCRLPSQGNAILF